MKITVHDDRAQLEGALTRLLDLLEVQHIDTGLARRLLEAGALTDACEVAVHAARGVPMLGAVRFEAAVLTAAAMAGRAVRVRA